MSDEEGDGADDVERSLGEAVAGRPVGQHHEVGLAEAALDVGVEGLVVGTVVEEVDAVDVVQPDVAVPVTAGRVLPLEPPRGR